MTTFRYSGLVSVRITYVDADCHYRVYLTTPTTLHRKGITYVLPECGIPGGYPARAVDAPETFDAVARVALARAVWDDLHREGEDFGHGVWHWTARPSHEQIAWETEDGTYPAHMEDRGVYHTDVKVARTLQAAGAWMADRPKALARKGA
jgi:hypothetical protein